MTTVTRFYRFEAAHTLTDERYGRCAGTHGHSYRVAVELSEGMATEELDELWTERVAPVVEYKHLNGAYADTTVEGLARTFYTDLIGPDSHPLSVTVREGGEREATYRP